MVLSDARDWVRATARNAGSADVFSDANIDRAIQTIGARFCANTRCVTRVDTAALADGSAVATLPVTTPWTTYFRPEMLLEAYIASADLAGRDADGRIDLKDYRELNESAIADSDEGIPTLLAFEDSTHAYVWKKSDAAYNLKLKWWMPFTTWTLGTNTATTLNIPDDLMVELLPLGVAPFLQRTVPEHLVWTTPAMKEYLALEMRCRGRNQLGAKTLSRRRAT